MRTLAIKQISRFHGRPTPMIAWSLMAYMGMMAMFVSAPSAQGRFIGNHMLAPLWIDDMDGFQIRPPKNCEVLQRKLKVPPPRHLGAVPVMPGDLVTFVNNALRWGIIVHLSELQNDVSLKSLLNQTVAEATHNYQNVQVLVRRMTVNSGKPAGILVLRFSTTSNGKPVVLMRQQLIVRAAPKLYYLLTFFSPGGQANGARQCFTAMIRTFHLINLVQVQQQRAAAVAAGRHWIHGISAEMLAAKHISSQLYQIKADGHGIGYVMLSCYPGTEDGYRGIFCATNARSFLPDGEVAFSKVVCFWALARQGSASGPAIHYNNWDKAVETLIPINNPQLVKMRQERIVIDPKTNKPKLEHIKIPYPNMEIHWVRETGDEQSASVPALNKHGQPTDLFVRHRWITVYTQHRQILPGQRNKPAHFDLPSYMPAYLPLTLKYFWPRLVDLTKPSSMAFVAYNSGDRRLGLRMLNVLGRQTISLHGKSMDVYHLTDQLDPGIANLWVKADGLLVKYQAANGTVWTPTTVAAMDRKWKVRLAALKQ